MAHVITQSCCNDASCVPVCPVGCIHPAPGEPGFGTTEMLYIDPATCIDCGVCVPECPVDAIVRDDQLTGTNERYRELNAAFYERNPITQALTPVTLNPPVVLPGPLRVAIVGSGPAGSYAATELLSHPGVEVSVFDRLPTPWGLVRAGVAPDHPSTKAVTELFERTIDNRRVTFHLNVEIGTHISHDELLEHHHAVVYAYGASSDRRLDIPGEDLPGSLAATQFVNWYNGHPDFADLEVDLSGKRAVVVGNGNVALDVARILVRDPDELAATDIADHALKALRESKIEEVVVLGRRGPAQAAYTTPELLGLRDVTGVEAVTVPAEAEMDDLSRDWANAEDAPASRAIKARLASELATQASSGVRRIVLRYLTSPLELLGTDSVTGIRIGHNSLVPADNGDLAAAPTGTEELLEAGLVIRSVGYRGRAIDGVPFDERRAVVPNVGGRVVGSDGTPMPGIYTTGWIKRGPSGVIGTNKQCAKETVANLLADFAAGQLAEPTLTAADLEALVGGREPDVMGVEQWRAIDRVERERGRATGKARNKIADRSELLAAARDNDKGGL